MIFLGLFDLEHRMKRGANLVARFGDQVGGCLDELGWVSEV